MDTRYGDDIVSLGEALGRRGISMWTTRWLDRLAIEMRAALSYEDAVIGSFWHSEGSIRFGFRTVLTFIDSMAPICIIRHHLHARIR